MGRPRQATKAAIAIGFALSISCSQAPQKSAATNAMVDSKACAACHAEIAKTYRLTGMARSFYSVKGEAAANSPPYYQRASGTSFQMVQREGGTYLRHWQTGPGGREESVEELKVDYVMGSGNHVRTYLHKTGRGTLVELPLAWYAEKGGYWAMNPGYDTEHWPARRKIGYDCMFCHNAYPAIPAGHEDAGSEPVFSGALPEGIDCQRCHGPGGNHVRAAQTKGAKPEEIARSIVNPGRLPPDRRMEVCLQCHLETTSFALPNTIRRFDRGAFSYRPGEPLSQFALFFDHAPGTGHDDKFEIVSSAYRLRKSKCFLESKGALTCTTCHNPHSIPRGAEAVAHYTSICRGCHSAALEKLAVAKKHTSDPNCISCHMPERRTEDVVHAVMTDHLIQRRPPGNALAELAEKHGRDAEYRGEVVPYGDSDELYSAIAQVSAKSNLPAGISRLEAQIAKRQPSQAAVYLELGDALRDTRKPDKAVGTYEEALRRKPGSALVMRRLAEALKDSGQTQKAREVLERATQSEPGNAEAWYDLGLLNSDPAALSKATELDPGLAEAHNALGAVLAEKGLVSEAEAALRRALQVQPTLADAHANLGNLLSAGNDPTDAAWHFEQAVRLAPEKALYRFNYAVMLARMNHMNDAQRQLEAAIQTDPNIAEAHDLLGNLYEQRGRGNDALKEYQKAVTIRSDFGKARLDIGAILASRGDATGAADQFRKAAGDSNSSVRQQALRALAEMGIR
jgi:predicted CXXCH cytochrome family protein